MQTPAAPGVPVARGALAAGRRRAAAHRPLAALCTVVSFACIWLSLSAPRPALPQAHRVAGVGGGAGIVAAPADAVLDSNPDTVLRITFLDVGQGDAVLLQAPEGQTALVDAGRGDVVPLLRQMGVERIDLLVATHPDRDHIGGMEGVIAALPVRFYMDNGDPHTTDTYRRLAAVLDARPDITYLEAVPRTISLGSAEIEVLPLLPRGTAQNNDRSVALVVRFGDFTAFLSGDSEVRQLNQLTGQRHVPDVTLLKAPHHGSDNGFTTGFLQAARPEVVVISVGRNGYGHPKAAALAAYSGIGAEVLRTDRAGHVTIRGRMDGRYDVALGRQAAGVATGGGRAAQAGVVVGAGTAQVPEAQRAAELRLGLRVHADARGNDNQNPNGEYAVIESREEDDLAIGGWRLCDAANHCFSFPPGAVLAAGGRIVVYTGRGQADGEHYYMGYRRAVWNNDGDTATLLDERGATVVVISY